MFDTIPDWRNSGLIYFDEVFIDLKKETKMKLSLVLPCASLAAPTTTTSSENLVTSPSVDWVLEMDSVMGGGSLGYLDRFDDHINFSGQLDLVNGGFASFKGNVGEAMAGYQGITLVVLSIEELVMSMTSPHDDDSS